MRNSGSVASTTNASLRTSSPSGRLELRYRRVVVPHPTPIAGVLSPNARLTCVLTGIRRRSAAGWHLAVTAYEAATGAVLGTRHTFPPARSIGSDALTVDPSGRYVLLANFDDRPSWVDLATGRLVTIPGRAAGRALGAAW